ncbi:ammonium transporter [Acinetobacter bouvetii]|uniref:Ammonium transporter n=3 Tax=Acinetobacter TaxID=469 RepID=A0A4Q7B4R4_9GAMM|nr:ammonium transporter [Acinetobacter bouvetii]RZG69858.1 ammonium transporter [Acinetobacter bouvetii]
MENTGIWVIGFIILFVLGSILGLRVSPREKALGIMRDKARKMGLHPRLVVAPDWTKIPMVSEKRASMVAYYSILLPEARLPLMRARVADQKLQLVHGDDKFKDLPIALKGIYAIDMQANCVGLYWDEESDLRATQLDDIKAYLNSLAELYFRPIKKQD